MASDKVTVTLSGSPIGQRPDQRQTLKGLGLTRRGKTVELERTPAVLGMINKVAHLVTVVSE
jgi:large subunit ribosomal protein L30